MIKSNYEIMYILNENITDFAPIEKQFVEWLGSKITKSEDLGVKKLSYPIQKQQTGHYFLIKVTTTKSGIVQFQRKILRLKGVLRWLVINLDKEKHFRYSDKPTKPISSAEQTKLVTPSSPAASQTKRLKSEKTAVSSATNQ